MKRKSPICAWRCKASYRIANPAAFHRSDAAGYVLWAEQVIALDAINPQVGARVARAFDRWKKFDAVRRTHAQGELTRIRNAPSLSRDIAEIVGKALA